ncbi:MAG: topoisomerase IV [Oscillospiraceae bacterium]|nr:topoisomerase IV [Oscillospiraceae bacterium]
MAKKKKTIEQQIPAAEPLDVRITEVLESNYMPYAMSVIVSRAIPAIDGFKPAHRKLLYTMYKMGLLTGPKAKSAKVVGQTMVLNPHGDAAIYETLVRLTTGKEALLHPFIESKGSFGKQYSDMAYAASRYTECKLAKISEEIFDGIDQDAVDMVPNYDGTTTEPNLLPTSFPNILVSANNGIAVGMTSTICSFNLREVCEATVQLIKNPQMDVEDLLDVLKGPDFSTGGLLLYQREKLRDIYTTGRGSVSVRSRYEYDPRANRIEITEIPYTTTVEKIKNAIVDQVKSGKIKEINDIRDETDINGLRIAIDLKRGADAEKLIARLNKQRILEENFSCNFNVLVGGVPQTLGVLEILDEWIAFRTECLRRNYIYDLTKKSDKLHLLYGLKEILLDIDKAIRIVRETESEKDVVPNLMSGFGIDEVQAEYVAEIKLRNLNREYIINRIDEIEDLEKAIDELNLLIGSDRRIRTVIAKQLTKIADKYGMPRKTLLLDPSELEEVDLTEPVEDYPCVMFLSREGYFKKCTPASLRGSDVQKFKENDSLLYKQEVSNACEVLFFTSLAQVYKSRMSDFDDCKASSLGTYVPAALSFEQNERVVAAIPLKSYEGSLVVFFENGKAVRIPLESYQTKTNRRKLTAALFAGSPAVGVFRAGNDGAAGEYFLQTDDKRALLVKEEQVVEKATRTSAGAAVFTLKKGKRVLSAELYDPNSLPLDRPARYRKTNLPSTGTPYDREATEK